MSEDERQGDFEEGLKNFSMEYEESLRRTLNELRQYVQEQFERYEQKIQELQSELDDRESKLIAMQWKHDIEQKEMMDKLKQQRE